MRMPGARAVCPGICEGSVPGEGSMSAGVCPGRGKEPTAKISVEQIENIWKSPYHTMSCKAIFYSLL
jgi:hypothetical protein